MITVIIAGGSGTRLWPLSTPEYPKHLLNLIGDKSLLQQAYIRAKKLGDTVYIVTESSHSDHVREQLSELPYENILIEPGRRGTAHCIIFALDYISRHHDKNESVAFVHSDHNIRDNEGYVRSFQLAAKVSTENKEIALIGIEPTYPATGFGYIERDGAIDADKGIYNVESFKEKPDFDTARQYYESGKYLWNCGYFVASTEVFIDEIRNNAPELLNSLEKLSSIGDFGSDGYNKEYLSLDNQVIDIALIEKTKKLAVVSASFDWMDVGSFKDLHNAVSSDEEGNFFTGNVYPIDVENVYVRNDEEKPVAVIGLDNVVVVNTPHGILVTRKSMSQRAGEVAKKIMAKE